MHLKKLLTSLCLSFCGSMNPSACAVVICVCFGHDKNNVNIN